MQITWDDYGVPYITGDDDNDVTYGVGFATATAHATEALELYGIARGASAALWGAAFVDEDRFHHALDLGAVTDEWFAAQAPSTLARIAAFCDGFNAACASDPQLGGARRDALPITARDVVAQMVRTHTRFTTLDGKARAFAAYVPGAKGTIQLPGSNGWAVAGSKATTGNAMLVINPHLGWAGYHRWFEFRTTSPSRNVHGITLLGLPWATVGFNPKAGWSHTVNPIPNLNVYLLDVNEDGYLFDGSRRAFESRSVDIDVRDGEPVTVQVRRSVHGPVVTAPDGATVALRISGVLHEPATGALETWWNLGQAETVAEMLDLVHADKLVMFNTLAADSTGSVLAAYCGAPAKHATATFEELAGRLPGDDPAYLWSETFAPESMPYVIDPPCGWVQNVNEAPWWYCDPPLDASAYPATISPPPSFSPDTRSAASRKPLIAMDKISPDAIMALKWSTHSVLADCVLDQLCNEAEKEDDLQAAVAVLRAWDREATADSPGYPLFAMWFLMHAEALLVPGFITNIAPPGELPTELGDVGRGVGFLRGAVMTLGMLGHKADVTLGEFAKMREGDVAVGADGGFCSIGLMKDLEPLPMGENGEWVAQYGDTYVGLVEFAPEGAKAQCLLPYGNSSEPGRQAKNTQIDLFAASQLRPVPSF